MRGGGGGAVWFPAVMLWNLWQSAWCLLFLPLAEAVLSINASAVPEGSISPNLSGHNLESTRHTLFQGLHAELILNRKFALQPPDPAWHFPSAGGWGAAFPPRWNAMGNAKVEVDSRTRGYAEGGNSIRCTVTPGVLCGLSQSQVADGFNSPKSWGSAITLQAGRKYALPASRGSASARHARQRWREHRAQF